MSPHRTFLDDIARLWNAWDVIPEWGDRRLAERLPPRRKGLVE